MGRKRKVWTAAVVGGENKACPETTGVDKGYSCSCQPPHAMKVINMGNAVDLSPKELNSKVNNVVRSDGLESLVLPKEGQKEKAVVLDLNMVDSAKGEDSVHPKVRTFLACERNLEEEATPNQKPKIVPAVYGSNLQQKVDCIAQAVDSIKSMFKKRQHEGPSTDLDYRSLYMDSLGKIESLMEKHYELLKELQFTHGKIDAYEKMGNGVASQKDVILVSSLEKAGEDQSHKFPFLKELSVLANPAAGDSSQEQLG